MELAEGTGAATLPRWYFNQGLMQCLAFNYRGMRGNQNNFLTRRQCQSACLSVLSGQEESPCPFESPMVTVNGSKIDCLPVGKTCPYGSWCHVGMEQETTLCCLNGKKFLGPGEIRTRAVGFKVQSAHHYTTGPCGYSWRMYAYVLFSAGSPCTQDISRGVGGGDLYRWGFNFELKECQSFRYRGLKGNQNNFITKRDCESICVERLQNPCPSGEISETNYCAEDRDCPVGFWCHRGSSNETTLCCPKG